MHRALYRLPVTVVTLLARSGRDKDLLCEVNDELVAAPRRYMAEATLTPLLDREEDRLPSIPAVTA